jgi:hypothetical protein
MATAYDHVDRGHLILQGGLEGTRTDVGVQIDDEPRAQFARKPAR